MAVDARALTASVIAQVSEPNVTFERDELQKGLTKGRLILHVRKKNYINVSLRSFDYRKRPNWPRRTRTCENKQTLQQSLMNARLLSQSARDEAANAANQNRIRELESALGAIHKIKKGRWS